jgi:hypothetical protein
MLPGDEGTLFSLGGDEIVVGTERLRVLGKTG